MRRRVRAVVTWQCATALVTSALTAAKVLGVAKRQCTRQAGEFALSGLCFFRFWKPKRVRLVSFWHPVIFRLMNDNTKITFIKEDPWRIFRIMAEFVDSFETLSQVGPGVTVFGSARTLPDNPYYQAAVELTRGLAKHKT